MEFFTSDNIKLNYNDLGSGFPILILTGYAGVKEIWNSQVKTLLNHGYRVINIDRRNHGQSQVTSKGLRMSRQGKDIAELIEYLNLTSFDFLGNSMGAAVIWAYCSLYGSEKINKIISVDQSPKMINDSSWNYGLTKLTWENFTKINDILSNTHTTYKHIDDDTFRLVKEFSAKNPFDNKLNEPLLIDHTFQDWRDVIQSVNAPILFVAGEKSPLWDYHHAIEASRLNSKSTYSIVKNAGHIVMAEQSETFNKVMLAFLKP